MTYVCNPTHVTVHCKEFSLYNAVNSKHLINKNTKIICLQHDLLNSLHNNSLPC